MALVHRTHQVRLWRPCQRAQHALALPVSKSGRHGVDQAEPTHVGCAPTLTKCCHMPDVDSSQGCLARAQNAGAWEAWVG